MGLFLHGTAKIYEKSPYQTKPQGRKRNRRACRNEIHERQKRSFPAWRVRIFLEQRVHGPLRLANPKSCRREIVRCSKPSPEVPGAAAARAVAGPKSLLPRLPRPCHGSGSRQWKLPFLVAA